MLVKINYSNGVSCCVGSEVVSSISFVEYLNSQFQFDEYGLGCESIEINFVKDWSLKLEKPVIKNNQTRQMVIV